MTLKVLMIEDSPDDEELVRHALEESGFDMVWKRVESREQLEDAFSREKWDVVLSDYNLPGFDAMGALSVYQNHGLDVPFIVLSGTVSEEAAVNVLKAGAHDFVVKSSLSRLAPAIERELREVAVRAACLQAEKALHNQEEMLAEIVAAIGEGVFVLDQAGRTIFINPEATRLLEWSPDDLVGQPLHGLVHAKQPDGKNLHEDQCPIWQVLTHGGNRRVEEDWFTCKDGTLVPVTYVVSSIYEAGSVKAAVVAFQDIGKRKKTEARLVHLAHYDHLTDLPNRTLLQLRLERALEHAKRTGHKVAMLYLGLDRFKNVNDSLGHLVGDELLVAVSHRLNQRIRKEDTLSRWGGDEFIILLERLDDPQETLNVTKDILKLLSEPFQVANVYEIFIGASIGITTFPVDGEDATQLIRNADAAMHKAKECGRNTYSYYTAEMTFVANERLELEGKLRHAIEREEFILHYQPLVSIEDRHIIGVEALVRWLHPSEGMISPLRFIPLTEETGLIVPLGEWVLRTACMQFKSWLDQGLPIHTLAVNLSSRQFQQRDLVERIRAILDETGLPATHLELEITESAIMEHGEQAIETLHALKALGLALSIDDFGTGYSSLAYLKRFPVDKLKIDRSFIRDIPNDQNDMEITATIVAMARNLHLKVLAEGVETPEQLAFLRDQHCDAYQGYLFSRPVPEKGLVALLEGQNVSRCHTLEGITASCQSGDFYHMIPEPV
jgi:diguanylate cyclase (GGDEF)-like protein/PAS domain S-box-containing protein